MVMYKLGLVARASVFGVQSDQAMPKPACSATETTVEKINFAWSKFRYAFQYANNKGADPTAWMPLIQELPDLGLL